MDTSPPRRFLNTLRVTDVTCPWLSLEKQENDRRLLQGPLDGCVFNLENQPQEVLPRDEDTAGVTVHHGHLLSTHVVAGHPPGFSQTETSRGHHFMMAWILPGPSWDVMVSSPKTSISLQHFCCISSLSFSFCVFTLCLSN